MSNEKGQENAASLQTGKTKEGDEQYMAMALSQAIKAAEKGEAPIGAIVVGADGVVIGEGNNKRIEDCDPTAHAEVVAIRAAAKKMGQWNLTGSTLFVTLEPCIMCVGAIINSRVSRVVFGAWDKRFGCAGSKEDFSSSDSFNHRFEVVGGVMAAECGKLLSDFFASLRKNKL